MENKPTCKELEQRLEWFSEIWDCINHGIAVYDVDEYGKVFRFKYVNSAVERIEKVNKEDLIGRDVAEVFPGVKDLGILDVFYRVWKTGDSEHFPLALYQDERISGWRDNFVSKLPSGEILAVYMDETERKQAEDALIKSELFYQKIFDTIQDGITVLDADMNIIKLNQAMEKWYSPAIPYRGKKCYQVYHGRESVCEGCAAAKALTTGRREVRTAPRGGPMGTRGWVELSAFPVFDSSGQVMGVVEFARDITVKKTAENQLRNSERQLKDIINFLPEPTWVIDNGGKVLYWNLAIEKLTGVPAEQIVGKGNYEHGLLFYGERRPVLIDLVLNPDREKEEKLGYTRNNEEQLESSETFHPLLGENGIYLSGSASRLYDSHGNVVGAIETLRNITERKHMEKEIRKLASTDPLTGTNNRRSFLEQAEAELSRSRRYNHPLTILMIDLDHFKNINDSYGHQSGDLTLQVFTETCLSVLRENDIFGRMGGEEFAALLVETDEKKAFMVAERLRKKLSEVVVSTDAISFHFQVSIGAANIRDNDAKIEDILKRADQALYKAKNLGRNRVVASSEIH